MRVFIYVRCLRAGTYIDGLQNGSTARKNAAQSVAIHMIHYFAMRIMNNKLALFQFYRA